MTELRHDPIIWMFQYQLEWYDLKAELARGALVEDWQASQHARQMRPGQVVYILKAGGRDGKDARQIEALGELCSEIYPTMGQDGKLYYSVNVRYRARIDPPLTRTGGSKTLAG